MRLDTACALSVLQVNTHNRRKVEVQAVHDQHKVFNQFIPITVAVKYPLHPSYPLHFPQFVRCPWERTSNIGDNHQPQQFHFPLPIHLLSLISTVERKEVPSVHLNPLVLRPSFGDDETVELEDVESSGHTRKEESCSCSTANVDNIESSTCH